MNNYEKIRSMTINNLAEYLYENWCHDNDPVIKWWDEKYCSNCEPVCADYFGKETEYAWCEVHHKCKYFPELDEYPDCKTTIRLWLEGEE